MAIRKLKNGGRKKALFGLGAEGAILAAAGINVAGSLTAAGLGAAATKSAAQDQAKATIENARRQAQAIKEQNEASKEMQESSQEFIKEQNEQNRDLQKDIQLQLQMLAGNQNVNDRLEASKIQVRNGGSTKRRLRTGGYPTSLLQGGDNMPFVVTDGGAVIPIGTTPEGYDLYEIKGNDHEHYHKTRGGKNKTGVGIKFADGKVIEGEGNQNGNQGEYLLNTPDNAYFISRHSIAGFNPAKMVNGGMHPLQAYAIQENLKAANGISDDGKHNSSPVEKMMGGMPNNFYNMVNANPLGFDTIGDAAVGTVYATRNNRPALKCGGRRKAERGLGYTILKNLGIVGGQGDYDGLINFLTAQGIIAEDAPTRKITLNSPNGPVEIEVPQQNTGVVMPGMIGGGANRYATAAIRQAANNTVKQAAKQATNKVIAQNNISVKDIAEAASNMTNGARQSFYEGLARVNNNKNVIVKGIEDVGSNIKNWYNNNVVSNVNKARQTLAHKKAVNYEPNYRNITRPKQNIKDVVNTNKANAVSDNTLDKTFWSLAGASGLGLAGITPYLVSLGEDLGKGNNTNTNVNNKASNNKKVKNSKSNSTVRTNSSNNNNTDTISVNKPSNPTTTADKVNNNSNNTNKVNTKTSTNNNSNNNTNNNSKTDFSNYKNFNEAFDAAEKAGLKEFTFGGLRYRVAREKDEEKEARNRRYGATRTAEEIRKLGYYSQYWKDRQERNKKMYGGNVRRKLSRGGAIRPKARNGYGWDWYSQTWTNNPNTNTNTNTNITGRVTPSTSYNSGSTTTRGGGFNWNSTDTANLIGAGIGALGNIGGAFITSAANRSAARSIANAQNQAAGMLANAYRSLTGIDMNSFRREDFAAAHAMPALQAPVSFAASRISGLDRQLQRRLANAGRYSASGAAALQRSNDAEVAIQDMRNQVHSADQQQMQAIRQANAERVTQAVMKNAELDTAANRDYTGAYLDLLQYNNDINNQRILGSAGALSEGAINAANAIAQARTANATAWSNALTGSSQGFVNTLSSMATRRADLAKVMLGASGDSQASYYANPELSSDNEARREYNNLNAQLDHLLASNKPEDVDTIRIIKRRINTIAAGRGFDMR